MAPALTWEEWKYPGGRIHNNFSGGGGAVGDIKMGRTEQATLLTTDAFDKVWAFYQNKCKLPAPGVSATNTRVEFGGNERAITLTVFDDVQPYSFEGPKNELIQSRGFSVQSLRYTLVGFVYRTTGADETCIHLVYRPNDEFIGLLKEKLAKE